MERLRHHYEVEKRIADRLRSSNRSERIHIMGNMYDELLLEVPDHPRFASYQDTQRYQTTITRQMSLLKGLLHKDITFAEFGPGGCGLSFRVCSKVAQVYAVDISNQIKTDVEPPDNFTFITYNGYDLDLPDNSIDIVFSDQMIEHLHPDDTLDHFRLVYRLLKPGGEYVLCTPPKLYGPCDISRYFSDVAQGFHLREWTFRELADLVKSIGFSQWRGHWCARGICFQMPRRLILALERLISLWPIKIRRRFGRYFLPTIAMTVQK